MFELDHLVITAPDLASGAAFVTKRVGCDLQSGGEHPKFGTHNALMNLSGASYLEVIARDPQRSPRVAPLWYGLDHPPARPALTHWVLRVSDLAQKQEALRGLYAPPITASRDGLHWQMSFPRPDAPRATPYLIDWGTISPPFLTLPQEDIALERLIIEDHQADVLRLHFGVFQLPNYIEIVMAASAKFTAKFTAEFTKDGQDLCRISS